MTEAEQRAAVIAEARSWISTPYHHAADIKGAGVDCGMLLVRVYVDTGIVQPFDPRPYPPDWNMHRSEERYLHEILTRTRELKDDETCGPGDVIVWLHGRTFSHGGIVTDWPRIIHAYHMSQVVEECDLDREIRLQFIGANPRPTRRFSFWGS